MVTKSPNASPTIKASGLMDVSTRTGGLGGAGEAVSRACQGNAHQKRQPKPESSTTPGSNNGQWYGGGFFCGWSIGLYTLSNKELLIE